MNLKKDLYLEKQQKRQSRVHYPSMKSQALAALVTKMWIQKAIYSSRLIILYTFFKTIAFKKSEQLHTKTVKKDSFFPFQSLFFVTKVWALLNGRSTHQVLRLSTSTCDICKRQDLLQLLFYPGVA